jgi:hypothetical protein
MPDLFDDRAGDVLTFDEYMKDADERQFVRGAGHPSWKLERRQSFSDPTDPPWVAFAEGRWEESLELMEAARPAFRKFMREASDHAVTLHRVRIVEIPILPYLQWELHYLLLAVDEGEKIRVVEADRISEFENNGPLPELLTAGRDTVYRILYTDEGVPAGARRVIDPARTGRCIEFIQELYTGGEDLSRFFDREVAHLPPPPRAG